MNRLKPWPRDAVMVTAAKAGEEKREEMEGVHVAQCRDCKAVLHADTFTPRVALGMPQRGGRPVLFFCVACHLDYDRSTIQVAIDHSGGKGLREREGERS